MMRDVNEILSQKEHELAGVRIEVEALRLIAPLLAEKTHAALSSEQASTHKMPVQGVGVSKPAKESTAERNIRLWP